MSERDFAKELGATKRFLICPRIQSVGSEVSKFDRC